MDETEQAPKATSVNYPLPGISSRRIFRRAAIRLNLSKESGRWNETQKTEWPYPSTYVRHQMPSKYNRSWRNELSNDLDLDSDTELNPLIIEYQKGLFDAGLVSEWVPFRYTHQARSNKDKSLNSTEDIEVAVSEEQAGAHRDFEIHPKNVFSQDCWKRVTKIEEVETDDEDVEKTTNKGAVTQMAVNTDNEGWETTDQKLEYPISNQEEIMQLQDLPLQYFPQDDIFTLGGLGGKMNHHSAAYIPHTHSPVNVPLIVIQASPETDMLLRGYDEATPENRHSYQNIHSHLNQNLGCEPPLHRMQTLHNACHLQLPQWQGSSMNDLLINLEPEWVYGQGPLLSHHAAHPKREEEQQAIMNQMQKIQLHQRERELHHLVLNHLSLEETLACSPHLYQQRLAAEDVEIQLEDPIFDAIAIAEEAEAEVEATFPLPLALA